MGAKAMTAARLALFDIDGTLVLTGGAGRRAIARAFAGLFAVDPLPELAFAGRTDAAIFADIAERHGIATDRTTLERLHRAYLDHLRYEIEQPGPAKGILPGVRSLLEHLSARSDVHLALLTGNLAEGARIKLEHFDLWRYFSGRQTQARQVERAEQARRVRQAGRADPLAIEASGSGGFGDAAIDRRDVYTAALAEVRARVGAVFVPAQTVVVGDTPLDVAVAVATGARSLAVATGGYDVPTLRAAGADAVVPDLSDTQRIIEALGLD